MISKFLGKGFVDFILNKLRIKRNVRGNFHVSTLFKGVLLFNLPFEEVQAWILAKGPWTLTDQLLALESWRPNFYPNRDKIRQARVWVWLLDFFMEL